VKNVNRNRLLCPAQLQILLADTPENELFPVIVRLQVVYAFGQSLP
jgi:hypothetical protein